VFISYRREDSSGHAGWLRQGLAERLGRDQVFMDIDTIKPGVDFVEVIERAVAECDVLLVLIGKEWLTTTGADGCRRLDNPEDYHRLEVEAALKRKIPVIPTLVQDATVPAASELPETLQTLTRRNAFKLDDTKWPSDVDTLSARVEETFKGEEGPLQPRGTEQGGSPPRPPEGRGSPESRRKRWTRLAIALLACTAVVGAVAWAVRPDPNPPEQNPPDPNPPEQNPPEPNPDAAYKALETLSYRTIVPSGPEWTTKPESEVNPGLFRTTIFGPRGIEIWIDHTPDEEARFARRGRAVQKRRRIDHPVFGLADEWVFRGGLSRCESVPCVDYLMNSPGKGYAVLGGGGDYGTARAEAQRVALRLTPR